ncbi:LacI family DNA-binding transcriptional regulator [Methylovirgula sp. 4M-Z18]|uniref:LacI family DNA-binding transcriptional regulator n=1 Tax=Methylovirgula sp. 4M-Z18 TaxID=2293567 RepID=UPI000E2FED1F|nr:LacI family DNA-binding transcriptional regulator [Methylovirgula sp. 4M-Z18]RFB80356.1 LacI family DNA-binding transcriptional regulator [Methylovirgula sp. 4M-Z18]
MAKRPTVTDLAQAAGVSVATVDRVLNGRLPVREATAHRVLEAAKHIGFHAAGLIGQRISHDRPEHRLGFLLLPHQTFYREFAREIETAAAETTQFRALPLIDYVPNLSPDEIVARLNALAKRVRAVALVAPDHPTLTAAVQALQDRQIPVFSLLSDFAAGVRQAYIGLDNRKVGRTAAWMIAKGAKRPGKVALFVGSHRFHGHELREIGFRAFFREQAPDFTVLDTMINLETGQITHEAILALLERHPDLIGCYVAGGGMEGAIRALREASPARDLVTICNELLPESRAALAENLITMVLSVPLPRLCRELIDLMARAVEGDVTAVPGQTFLPFDIFLPENI